MPLRLLALALALAPALASPAAAASKRTVILPFSGPKSGDVRKAVVAAFGRQGRIELVSSSAFLSAASRLGYTRRDLRKDANLAAIAAEVKADAVVHGATSRSRARRQWDLQLTVHDGGTGGVIGKHRFKLNRGRADKATARRIVSVTIPSIVKGQWRPASGAAPADEPPAEDPLAVEPAPLDPLASPREPPSRWSPRPAEPASLVAPEDTVREEDRGAPVPADGLNLEVGYIGLSRSYSLTGGRTPAGEDLPHKYESGLTTGLWFRTEVYPLALMGDRGVMRDLGVEAYLDMGFLESDLKVIDARGVPEDRKGVETTQRMWGLGGVYRMTPGSTKTGPVMLKVMVGYHAATFALAERTPLYQRNDYGALRLGAHLSAPVGRSSGWTYALFGRLAGLYVRAGLNRDELYPTTGGLGWEAAGGVDVAFGGAWSMSADYRAWSLSTEYEAKGADNPALTSDDLYHGFVVQVRYRR